jgi:hypothetical protein
MSHHTHPTPLNLPLAKACQEKGDPMRRRSRTSLFSACAVSLLSLSSFSCGSEETPADPCSPIKAYVPSSTAALSYATDIHPILMNATLAVGCSQTAICHGTSPRDLKDDDPNTAATVLSFIDPPATVKAALLAQVPVNAPSMKYVVPGNVGASFMAYKIAATPALMACANPMCVMNSSVGMSEPCGDLMPTGGMLTNAERTKILDWIANGAAD